MKQRDNSRFEWIKVQTYLTLPVGGINLVHT